MPTPLARPDPPSVIPPHLIGRSPTRASISRWSAEAVGVGEGLAEGPGVGAWGALEGRAATAAANSGDGKQQKKLNGLGALHAI